jgi:outer membrane protein assembly factor BamB
VVAAFSSGELVALSAANGSELWNQQLSRNSRTTALSEIRDIPGRPVVFRGDVMAGSHSGVFASVDLRTGQFRWDPLPISMLGTPWAAGDVIYVTSKAGEVVCVARSSGQVYWVRDLNAGRKQVRASRFLGLTKIDRPYWSGPILASNRLISVSTSSA